MGQKKKLRWLALLGNLDVVLGVGCMIVLVVVTFVSAIMRYFFNNPIIWQEEVQTWMIIWAIFSGASYAFRQGAHVAIEILVEKFSPKVQAVLEWFSFVCTTAVLLFVCSNALTLNIQFYSMNKITSILKIPSWQIYWIVPVGCVYMILSYGYVMLKKYILRTPVEPTPEGDEPA